MQAGSVTLLNTIVAGNTAVIADPDIAGTIAVGSYSLIGNTTGNTIMSSTSDVTNVSAGLQSTLGSNGGPTKTLALLPTSAAINTGGGSYLATDQRGISRGSVPDIGAFELETIISSTANLPATSTSITISGNAFDTTAANDTVPSAMA